MNQRGEDIDCAYQQAAQAMGQYEAAGDLAALETTISILDQIVAVAPPDHPLFAEFLGNLGTALEYRNEHDGDFRTLAAAIHAYRRAAGMAPNHVAILNNLGNVLDRWYDGSGDLADLDEAIASFRRALTVLPAGMPEYVSVLNNLAGALGKRYRHSDGLADLNEAVETQRQALHASPAGHPLYVRRVTNLGNLLRQRHERLGDAADLTETLTCYRYVAAACPDDPIALDSLGYALQLQHQLAADRATLDEAIGYHRAAVTATGHPRYAQHLNNLGRALHLLYEASDDLDAFEEGLECFRHAAAIAPAGDPARGSYLVNIGAALLARSIATWDWGLLEQAVEACREAVVAAPERPAGWRHLGYALQMRGDMTADHAALGEAIDCHRRAVAATPAGHPHEQERQRALAAALGLRHSHGGDLAALHEAIRIYRHLNSATDLGSSLLALHEHTGDLAALQEAIGHLRHAAAGAQALNELAEFGRALQLWHGQTGDQDALVEARQVMLRAVQVTDAPAEVRIRTGIGLGLAAASLGDWHNASNGFELAVELLSQLVPRHLVDKSQHRTLRRFRGLAGNAAACAIAAGRPERAVDLLEQGRGMLLAQALDLRHDIGELSRRQPALAEEYVRLRNRLSTPDETMSATFATLPPELRARADPFATDPALTREWDALLSRIRAEDSFDGFLRALSAHEMCRMAGAGPIVLVNVTNYRSDALVLTPSGVEVVSLPEISEQSLVARFADVMPYVYLAGAAGTATPDRRVAQQLLLGLLAWLWDTVAGPVLERLGLTTTPDGELPRIWWVSTGPMAHVPIHAAGHHDERGQPGARIVMDRVTSSYTPTVRALGHRSSRPPATPARALVVSMPRTPGANALPGVEREAANVSTKFADVTHLTGEWATRDSVLSHLGGASYAHFACHGYSDLVDPSAGRLLLHDHEVRPLTVADISQVIFDDAELAYLSACDTARGALAMGDEALHIAGAFRIAGYRHVIGTLWPINDEVSPDIAEAFYTHLTGSRGCPATALHATTRWLRDRYPRLPVLWASHVHVGA